jgi:hypothetical protein
MIKTYLNFTIVAILIISIALLRHPSLSSGYTLQKYIDNINTLDQLQSDDNSIKQAQELWKFREFYSRGEIVLSKYENITYPTIIAEFLPESFDVYLLFSAKKTKSIEGTISTEDWNKLLSEYDKGINFVKSEDGSNTIIIGLFDIESASKANGFLHFDLRNDEFKKNSENKMWLVVTMVRL